MEWSKPVNQYSSRTLGNIGEELASKFLEEKGFVILEKNYSIKQGEIDIIATDKNWLVFVEVKSAYHFNSGDPALWVNRKKQKRIISVAKHYLFKNKIIDKPCRFDVVTLQFKENIPEILHYENGFIETY